MPSDSVNGLDLPASAASQNDPSLDTSTNNSYNFSSQHSVGNDATNSDGDESTVAPRLASPETLASESSTNISESTTVLGTSTTTIGDATPILGESSAIATNIIKSLQGLPFSQKTNISTADRDAFNESLSTFSNLQVHGSFESLNLPVMIMQRDGVSLDPKNIVFLGPVPIPPSIPTASLPTSNPIPLLGEQLTNLQQTGKEVANDSQQQHCESSNVDLTNIPTNTS